jgi:hypothetical protein
MNAGFCRLAGVDAGLYCRSGCGVEGFEVKLKKFNGRCENRSVESFSLWLQIAGSEID